MRDSERAVAFRDSPLAVWHLPLPTYGGHYLNLNISLGETIHRLRMEQNMTQRALAYHLRVSEQAVSKWERGLAYPDVTLLVPIAELFSVSLDTLFGRDWEKT